MAQGRDYEDTRLAADVLKGQGGPQQLIPLSAQYQPLPSQQALEQERERFLLEQQRGETQQFVPQAVQYQSASAQQNWRGEQGQALLEQQQQKASMDAQL